jgi:hypothetical protein
MMIACGPARKIAPEPDDQGRRAAAMYGISGDSAAFKKLRTGNNFIKRENVLILEHPSCLYVASASRVGRSRLQLYTALSKLQLYTALSRLQLYTAF